MSNIIRTSLGVDASGFERFEVKDTSTGEILGYDLVGPEESE